MRTKYFFSSGYIYNFSNETRAEKLRKIPMKMRMNAQIKCTDDDIMIKDPRTESWMNVLSTFYAEVLKKGIYTTSCVCRLKEEMASWFWSVFGGAEGQRANAISICRDEIDPSNAT